MENYLSEIKKKLTKNLKLEIKSNELNLLTRIEAQKKIMNILRNDLELKIHALEIKIK